MTIHLLRWCTKNDFIQGYEVCPPGETRLNVPSPKPHSVVSLRGESLKTVLNFEYVVSRAQCDGACAAHLKHCTEVAVERFTSLWCIWKNASSPSFDVLEAVKTRRWRWPGHILRMNEDRFMRRTQIATSQQCPPYDPGSILTELHRPTVECLATFAAEPHQFRAEWRRAERD